MQCSEPSHLVFPPQARFDNLYVCLSNVKVHVIAYLRFVVVEVNRVKSFVIVMYYSECKWVKKSIWQTP